jgi:hypothetical protein
MNQGPRYVRFMGKSRGKKSRATVPLKDGFGQKKRVGYRSVDQI